MFELRDCATVGLLVSYRPLARSQTLRELAAPRGCAMAKKTKAKAPAKKPSAAKAKKAERWLLRRRGIGRGLQELRRVQDQGEPAGQSLAWRDRRGQQRESRKGAFVVTVGGEPVLELLDAKRRFPR